MRYAYGLLAISLVACGGDAFSTGARRAALTQPEAGVDAEPLEASADGGGWTDAIEEQAREADPPDSGSLEGDAELEGGDVDGGADATPPTLATLAPLVACAATDTTPPAMTWDYVGCNSEPQVANDNYLVFWLSDGGAQNTCGPTQGNAANCPAGTPCIAHGTLQGTCLGCAWANGTVPASEVPSCATGLQAVICNTAPTGCAVVGNGPYWCCPPNLAGPQPR